MNYRMIKLTNFLSHLICLVMLFWFAGQICAQESDNYRSLLRDKNVKVESTNLPIIFIEVGGRMILRDSYVLAKMKIIHNGEGQTNHADTISWSGQHVDYEGWIALKYRGNSSFTESDKKPYAFRTLESNDLDGKKKKVSILGMPKDNKWGFIAPWSDETMFRDILSFELGRPWFEWVPKAHLCEVILDGTYYGVFAICERVSKGKSRLDLNDPGETDGDLTGDYHVSVDHGYDPHFISNYHPWQSMDGVKVAWDYNIKYEYGDPEDDEYLPYDYPGEYIYLVLIPSVGELYQNRVEYKIREHTDGKYRHEYEIIHGLLNVAHARVDRVLRSVADIQQ